MICVVLLFDRVHWAAFMERFCDDCLIDEADLDRLRSIATACLES